MWARPSGVRCAMITVTEARALRALELPPAGAGGGRRQGRVWAWSWPSRCVRRPRYRLLPTLRWTATPSARATSKTPRPGCGWSAEIMAGDDPGALVVGEGEAVRIMTGAVLAGGADAVCMVEHTRSKMAGGYSTSAVAAGTNVRPAGGDIAPGAEVFAAGVRLGPAHIGVLASLGAEEVTVYPRPRVGVVSTGDELMTGPGPLTPGKIRDSNRASLLARLRADGFVGVGPRPGP